MVCARRRAGVYGSIIIDENTGEWVYNLDANDVQRLSENQLFIEHFKIEASDSFGGVDATTITIQITEQMIPGNHKRN